VPFGPELQYTGEKRPADPLTSLRFMLGQNGAFTLYEDQVNDVRLREGRVLRRSLKWDEASGTLTLGKQAGLLSGNAEGADRRGWCWCRPATPGASASTRSRLRP